MIRSLHFRFLKICSHAVAVGEKENCLKEVLKGARISYRSAITYPESKGGEGRKGGKKRKSRIYVERQEGEAPSKKPNDPLFTKVWHNNEPLLVIKTRDVPAEKSRCGYCGTEFPCGILSIVPFDIALSHKERWEYRNKNRSSPSEPEFLQSPHGEKTTRYYCIKKDCIIKRFPYFKVELLEIPDDVVLKDAHKKLLRDQLGLLC